MYCGNSKIEKKVTLILAAAGVGKRMGLSYPKQFLEYNNKPLFVTPLEVAESSNIIDNIIIVTNEDNIQLVENICKKYSITKRVFSLVSDRADNSCKEHEQILKLMEAKQYDEVEAAVRLHKLTAGEKMTDQLRGQNAGQ